ncbi:zinc-binding alcohol dehydrogenase [Paralimibaculum aggregatum]|uniref:Zinc-binding alcohol dehydrogenase n=1 Tax=Paralimibaculum aggregatum TaxID=3036245 RepID=A0ABQ6LI45_9RHOB|nr:zinc-binding alcohol dehydrogenase [Limibaculum sp. NKW23]GMG81890.1 zinc-binding alcohol dehydrogenase [Limibaculum sp. NKW23]
MAETTDAFWYVGDGRGEIRPTALPPLAPGWVEVETTHSALSRGTERLVAQGRVPESERARMRAPFQEGDFPHPVKYGYAAVGRVVAGAGPEAAALIGREVFALHPHQARFRVPAAAALPLPEGVPPERAVLAANAETALNAIWDADIAPGSRVLVVGAGLLGCLVAGLLAPRNDLEVVIADVIASRRSIAGELNVTFRQATETGSGYVVAIHTSASAAGLQTALDALDFEGRVVELSWYGDRPVEVSLGGAFHSRRLRLISSQVGHVAPARRASTSRRDRLACALAALAAPRFDALVTETVAFTSLPERIDRLLAPDAAGIATCIRYD